MGISGAKESYDHSCFYSELLRMNKTLIKSYLDKHPEWIDQALASDCKMSPMCLAASRGNVELLDYLLSLGANINSVGN